jgi:hypothetical protein
MTARIRKFNSCFGCEQLSNGCVCELSGRRMTETEMINTPDWCRYPKILSISECDGFNIIKIESGKKIG